VGDTKFIGQTGLVRAELLSDEYLFFSLRVPSHKSGAYFGVEDIDTTITLLQRARKYLTDPAARAVLPDTRRCPVCETGPFVCCECHQEVPTNTPFRVSYLDNEKHLFCNECFEDLRMEQ